MKCLNRPNIYHPEHYFTMQKSKHNKYIHTGIKKTDVFWRDTVCTITYTERHIDLNEINSEQNVIVTYTNVNYLSVV